MTKGYVASGFRRIYARIDGQFVPIGWVHKDTIVPGAQFTVYEKPRRAYDYE